MSRTASPDTATRKVANLERTLVRRQYAVTTAKSRLHDAEVALKATRAELKAARTVAGLLEGGGTDE